jgi:hypothetical protein
VYQFPTGFSNASCGTESTIGEGSTGGVPVFAGTFDNNYFTSTGGSASGNLYVCGNTEAEATLYQVRINSNVIDTTGANVLALSSAGTTCSPVAEVYNGTTDWIFLSVESNGSTSAKCPIGGGGCVMSFSVPTSLTGSLPGSATAAAGESGGTSGIVIGNTVSQGSLINFSTLSRSKCRTGGTGGCAVQVSQSGLD